MERTDRTTVRAAVAVAALVGALLVIGDGRAAAANTGTVLGRRDVIAYASDIGDANPGPAVGFPVAPGKDFDLYALSADGTERLTAVVGNDQFQAWSPDGTRIAFESSRATDALPWVDFDIFVMDADGANVTRLTTTPGFDTTPAWSPDGTHISFTSFRDGDPELYVMDADGSDQRRVTFSPGWDFAFGNWCPDGRIVFHSDRGAPALPAEPVPVRTFDVYSMRPDGSQVRRLTDDPGNDQDAECSPDGASVAFASDRAGSLDLYTIPIDGGTPRRLTDQAAAEQRPTWSPDSTRLAFDGSQDGDPEIYVLDLNDLRSTQLTHNTVDDIRASWRPLPPTGRRPPTTPHEGDAT